jgi:CBS domain-containing protein
VIVHGGKAKEKGYVCYEMLQETLHTEPIKGILPETTVAEALEFMDDLKISHLPLVTKDGLYAGLLSEDALYESEDDTQPAQSTLRQGFFPHVREGAHFFEVMEVCTQHRITLVPVVNTAGRYINSFLLSDILEFFRATPTLLQTGAMLVVSIAAEQYSLVEIAHAVEHNDAKLLGLWMTHKAVETSLQLTLKLNLEHTAPIIKSLQRYGYEIEGIFGDESYDADYRERYDHLMNYLKYS